MTETFIVNTSNFIIGKRSYSFTYELFRNGKRIACEKYDATHTRHRETIKRYLMDGGAAELVLQREIG